MKNIFASGPLHQLQSTVSRQAEQIQDLQAQVTRWQLAATHAQNELHQTHQLAANSTHSLQQAAAQLSDCQQQLRDAQSRKDNLEQQLHDAQLGYQEQLQQLKQQLAKAVASQQQLQSQLQEAATTHSSMNDKLAAIKSKLGLSESEARAYVQELETQRLRAAQFTSRCEQLEGDNERLATQLEARGRHVLLLLEDNQRLGAANTALKQQLAHLAASGGTAAWGSTHGSSSSKGRPGSCGDTAALGAVAVEGGSGVLLVRRGRRVTGKPTNSSTCPTTSNPSTASTSKQQSSAGMQERPPWQGPQDSGRYRPRAGLTTPPSTSRAGAKPGSSSSSGPSSTAATRLASDVGTGSHLKAVGQAARLRDQHGAPGAAKTSYSPGGDRCAGLRPGCDQAEAELAAWRRQTAQEALTAALQQVAVAAGAAGAAGQGLLSPSADGHANGEDSLPDVPAVGALQV